MLLPVCYMVNLHAGSPEKAYLSLFLFSIVLQTTAKIYSVPSPQFFVLNSTKLFSSFLLSSSLDSFFNKLINTEIELQLCLQQFFLSTYIYKPIIKLFFFFSLCSISSL